jgi:hypothetical protein
MKRITIQPSIITVEIDRQLPNAHEPDPALEVDVYRSEVRVAGTIELYRGDPVDLRHAELTEYERQQVLAAIAAEWMAWDREGQA